jgi:hypothetical protein
LPLGHISFKLLTARHRLTTTSPKMNSSRMSTTSLASSTSVTTSMHMMMLLLSLLRLHHVWSCLFSFQFFARVLCSSIWIICDRFLMFNEIYSSTLLVCMVTITNVSSLLVIYLNKSYGSLLIFSTLSKLKCYTLGVMH